MSGKDMASKLRDYGFSKAKSHMSALDEFEVMQAKGVLEANGHAPAGDEPKKATEDESESLGSGFIRRKKKKDDDGASAAKPAPAPAPAPTPAPTPDAVPSPAPEAEAPQAPSVEPDPVPQASAPEAAPEPKAVEAPPAAPLGPIARAMAAKRAAEEAEAAAAAAAAAAAKIPAAEATPAPANPAPTSTEATESVSPEPELAQAEVTPAPSHQVDEEPAGGEPVAASPVESTTESSEQPAGEPAESPAAGPTEPPHVDAVASDAVASADAPASEAAKSDDSAQPTATSPEAVSVPAEEAAGGAKEAEAGAAASGPKAKGNVIGFIDPSTFQSQSNTRRPQSRRIQSRDDVTPDVRPTFGRGPGAGKAAGPRGELTATQLREREQGRFLRRSRPGGPGSGGRGRGGSGGRGRGRGRGRGGFQDAAIVSPLAGTETVIEAPITVGKLAETLKLKSAVVQKMAMERGYGIFNLNNIIDEDTALLLAGEYEVELDIRHEVSAEEQHLDEVRSKRSGIEEDELVDRAPTVAFLGHVDHGKTTLIDKIRETSIADGEAGGITQHIAAYQVHTSSGNTLTVIDTPGHAAFTQMRARGANAVDVIILVVAGDDGVKPSTEEAMAHAKAAGTPVVVAINKKDKPGFNPNQVIQQLMGLELVPEQYGGNTAMFETSGLTGEGLNELLDHVFLMAEAELGLKAHPRGPASGVVLEAEIQQGRGIVAQLLVQDGTLSKGDVILAGEGYGKVKSIQDHNGKTITAAGPATPVAVTGLDALPGVGDEFFVIDQLAKAKEIAQERERTNRAMALAQAAGSNRGLDAFLGKAPSNTSIINLIVRCDVQGTVEVIKNEIQNLKHDEVEFKLVHSGVGPITESDATLAVTSDATLIAFNVGINGKARQEAKQAKVAILRVNVIYELLDTLRDMMEGALSPDLQEEVVGHVEIKRIFKSSRIGAIAGCVVLDGTINRNNRVRLLRDDKVIYQGDLASLKRESEDVREVREGFECGLVLRDYRDIKEGDIVEAFAVKEVKRYLER